MVARVQRRGLVDRVWCDAARCAVAVRHRTGRHPQGRTVVRETRAMPVPDGLDGMRVDAGLARLLGLSRTVVATLTDGGAVLLDGTAAGKSDRLAAGAWLEVELPEPPRTLTIEAEPVEGMEILYA